MYYEPGRRTGSGIASSAGAPGPANSHPHMPRPDHHQEIRDSVGFFGRACPAHELPYSHAADSQPGGFSACRPWPSSPERNRPERNAALGSRRGSLPELNHHVALSASPLAILERGPALRRAPNSSTSCGAGRRPRLPRLDVIPAGVARYRPRQEEIGTMRRASGIPSGQA